MTQTDIGHVETTGIGLFGDSPYDPKKDYSPVNTDRSMLDKKPKKAIEVDEIVFEEKVTPKRAKKRDETRVGSSPPPQQEVPTQQMSFFEEDVPDLSNITSDGEEDGDANLDGDDQADVAPPVTLQNPEEGNHYVSKEVGKENPMDESVFAKADGKASEVEAKKSKYFD